MSSQQTEKGYAQVVTVMAVVILGSCLGNLSQTALNAMFSGMAGDFSVDVGFGQWVTTLYMLVMGITVPAVTYLMRRFATKTLILIALALLLAGGVIDALADSFALLIAGRVLQAVSAGITMPMMITLVMISFPPDKQATVMGIAGIAMGFAPNIGPTIGGYMIEWAGWRSFFVALSFCSALLILVALVAVRSEQHEKGQARLDIASLVLSALAFGGLLLGFSNASSFGFASPFIWVPVVLGAAFLVVFLRRQRRIDHPLISLDIFASRRYLIGFWTTNALFGCYMGITLVLPLFIENLWGGTAVDAGLSLLPGTIAAFFINPLAGVLTDKIGVRPVVVTASVFLALGSVGMVFIDAATPFWAIFALQGVRAIGVSGLIGPLSSWSLSELPHAIMGDGSSFSTAARQACASLGTALMVFAITLGPSMGGAALGYQAAFALSGLFAVATLALALKSVR